MTAIPLKMRKVIALDQEMTHCFYTKLGRGGECQGKVEWEHAFTYSGKRLNEPWAIIGVCTYHHRGPGLNKALNRFMALRRADLAEVELHYPKVDWKQLYSHLSHQFSTLAL